MRVKTEAMSKSKETPFPSMLSLVEEVGPLAMMAKAQDLMMAGYRAGRETSGWQVADRTFDPARAMAKFVDGMIQPGVASWMTPASYTLAAASWLAMPWWMSPTVWTSLQNAATTPAEASPLANAAEAPIKLEQPANDIEAFLDVSAESATKAAVPFAAKPRAAKPKPAVPEKPDDLTILRGIGAKLQADLNKLGIVSLRQIAALSAEEQQDLSEKIGFPGRIARDAWVAQAQALTMVAERKRG
jgi:predicted flap endonuclease-1-like 5' DNA nuclease